MDNHKDSNHSEGSTSDEQYINPKTGKRYSHSWIYKLQHPEKVPQYNMAESRKYNSKRSSAYYAKTFKDKVVTCDVCNKQLLSHSIRQHNTTKKHLRNLHNI